MGRKSKNQTLEEKVNTVMNETNKQPNFTHKALTLWYNKENDTWNVVQVLVDPTTSSSGKVEVIQSDRHQSIVFEYLKLELEKMVEN